MHPELLNNSIFLRYYRQWQDDPSSIVFASIANFFLSYDMIDEAFKVCRMGVKRHPKLVSGRIVMAKIHLRRGNWEEAEDELRNVLSVVPSNRQAQALMEEIAGVRESERAFASESKAMRRPVVHSLEDAAPAPLPEPSPSWKTVTMAGIYASQGHFDRARGIYEAILKSDPQNEAARRGLETLPAV
ncbi:MAG TPA: tetratricopeptide repeat protein [bacterium]|nr:tetratricopeptide repeat protein [bacterium]